MITTDKFDLTRKEYLSVILKMLVKKKWWKFLIFWAFAVFLTFEAEKSGLILFCLFFLYAFPFIMVFEYWRFANSKDNRKIFGERYYEISSEEVKAYLDTGSNSSIKLSQFVKTYELKNYYFLYISKTQSLYFPKRIFKSEADIQWFKANIFDRIK